MNDSFFSEIIGNNITKDRFKCVNIPQHLHGLSNIGLSRSKNQDAISYFLEKSSGHLFLSLADGLGSYIHSEKAAYLSVKNIPQLIFSGESIEQACLKYHELFLKSYPYDKKSIRGRFRQYLKRKIQTPKAISENTHTDCGSSTFVCAEIKNNQLNIANVGDSRAYVFRQQKIHFMTEDQSLAQLIKFKSNEGQTIIEPPANIKGAIINSLGSPEPFYEFPRSNKKIEKIASGSPITYTLELIPGDIILLASDGLFANLGEHELQKIINETPWDELHDTFEKIILRVMRMGWTNMGIKANPDNFSFIIYRHF